jgi:protein SCO1/2
MPVSSKTAAMAAIAAVVVVLGVTAVVSFSPSDPDRFAQCRRGAGTAGAKIGGPFTLVSQTGATVTEAEVITKPSLVYFGYTWCPDVCPIDSTRNAAAVDLLQSRGDDVTPVFISVDSARDTPETLTGFTALMSPKMIGLGGSPAQIDAVVKAYRAYYRVQKPGDPNTLIDHSTQTYLMDPKLGFLDYYDRDTSPEAVAKSVGCFMDALKTKEKQP